MPGDDAGGTRSPYAADPARSRGRLHDEPKSPTRTEFQRDRDRIVHSTAFRRLAHKTQVFVHEEGDHFRTRLTHTIEVAQIARSIARDLRLDEDLAEAVALGHDLGHTPFGHTGEDALAACLADYGGFDHNTHGFRIVTALERRYADFDGLNLTAETLEGLVKHNGPLLTKEGAPRRGRPVPTAICGYDERQSLRLDDFASLEAESAAVADDIAYLAHDVDDGLRAKLFTLDDLAKVPLVAGFLDEIHAWRPGLETDRIIHELGRRLITRLIEDVVATARMRLAAWRGLGERSTPAVEFSPSVEASSRALREFLFANMYRHPRVRAAREEADAVVRRLYAAFVARPEALPPLWRERVAAQGAPSTVGDYIAGMTDRFALSEYRRVFDEAPPLR